MKAREYILSFENQFPKQKHPRSDLRTQNYAAWYCLKKTNDSVIQNSYSCHAMMMDPGLWWKEFATILLSRTSDQILWNNFILSDKSPWISVIPKDSYELIHTDDGDLIGMEFKTPEHALKYPALFYNFLIATRQGNDGYVTTPLFEMIHETAPELPLADCYVISRMFYTGNKTNNDVILGEFNKGNFINGWHTPLGAVRGTYFSPTRFREQSPRPASDNIRVAVANDVWDMDQNVDISELITKNFGVSSQSQFVKGVNVKGVKLSEFLPFYMEKIYDL